MNEDRRLTTIDDVCCRLHKGMWWTYTDLNNRTYANLRIRENYAHGQAYIADVGALPTEEFINSEMIRMNQEIDDAEAKKAADKTSGNNKLKALGLTDDEITAITKG